MGNISLSREHIILKRNDNLILLCNSLAEKGKLTAPIIDCNKKSQINLLVELKNLSVKKESKQSKIGVHKVSKQHYVINNRRNK